jgi:hypothetical protein
LTLFGRSRREDAERAVAWLGEALGLREIAFRDFDGHHVWGCHPEAGGHGAGVNWDSGKARFHVGLPLDWRRRWATLRECAIDAARATGCVVWFDDPADPPEPGHPYFFVHEVRPNGSVGPLRCHPCGAEGAEPGAAPDPAA